ncbi:MAG: prephenate dehydrogenase/arogenate dehydrogenase family protein [Pseudomonadota bacterium]
MLEDLRSELNDLDRQLVDLIARRQAVVQRIGATKRDTGTATRDYGREKVVLELARKNAESQGISPKLAETVMTMLIEGSLQAQEKDRLVHASSGSNQRALVFGGCGKMGRWFADFLASQSFAVDIVDPSDVGSRHARVDRWQDVVDQYDLLVVAAPIKVSAELLRELLPLKPRGTIFDLASLKSPLRQPLRALADAGCSVTSVHPMFGPDTHLLSGRHVIFCDVGVASATEHAVSLFANTMAEKVEMSLEDHDRMVGYVLGLSHALNIAFFTALRESGEASNVLADLSSTTFDAQLAIARAVAGEHPPMYFEIQHLNDYGRAPLSALADALSRIRELVERGDEAGFVQLMEKGHQYLVSTSKEP